jgi:hypothetical protein
LSFLRQWFEMTMKLFLINHSWQEHFWMDIK